MNKFKFIFVLLNVMYDGIEFTEHHVRKIPKDADPLVWADENMAKKWADESDRDSEEPQPRDGYYFHGMQYRVYAQKAVAITEEEFNILNKYL